MTLEEELSQYSYEILSENYLEYDISFKIIVIGDSGVGKSLLTSKGINNKINKNDATIGFEYYTFNIKINEKVCKLQIWDTCGQEIYKSLILNFYRNSSLVIIVYSIDNINSFEDVENWKNEVIKNCDSNTKIILVGNKNDLKQQRQVSFNDGLDCCKKNNFDCFFESSSVSELNVQKIFIKAAFLLYEDFLKIENTNLTKETSDYKNNITIEPSKVEDKKNRCCFLN